MKTDTFINKNVYITGGSSGMGLSLAKLLAGKGANIIILARRKKELTAAVEEISKHKVKEYPKQQISFQEMDVTHPDKIKTSVENAVKEIGEPDILINCAGGARPDYFENIDYNQFDEIIKVNLYGVRNTIFAVLPYMKPKGGHIINVSSMAGLIGVFGYTDYCAAKFGMIGFSEALRSELKKYQIRVSLLCPPDVDTPGLKKENETKPKETVAISKNAKILHPDFVAKILIRDIMKGKDLIIPGFESKLFFLIKRFFPKLIDIIVDASIKKAI